MTDEMKQKRDSLKKLSATAAQMVKEMPDQYSSVNDALVAMYAEQGHTEIHSFNKWKEKGFTVCRGEKALLLWGEPKKALKQEKQAEGEKDEFKFYPLAFVFSQKQVEPIRELTR
jgi:hypothetical protein